jgi:methylmalonyl-CoA mutase, N-terminal domain
VNSYTEGGEGQIEILRIDPALERKQIDRVQGVRARRDAAAVEAQLAELKTAAAQDDHNLMPNLLECARVHASEGEIVEALQSVFGTYTESPVF